MDSSINIIRRNVNKANPYNKSIRKKHCGEVGRRLVHLVTHTSAQEVFPGNTD